MKICPILTLSREGYFHLAIEPMWVAEKSSLDFSFVTFLFIKKKKSKTKFCQKSKKYCRTIIKNFNNLQSFNTFNVSISRYDFQKKCFD